jgi:hypothetical protein
MKSIIRLGVIALLMASFACGNKASQDHSGHTMNNDDDPNQALYNEVMDIHDEVMPFTENLYNLNKDLKVLLKDATDESVKADLAKRIRYVDSVNTMMMDWMRKFNPPDSTTNEEVARAYYESELEKIKQVKEAILTALEKEKK